VENDKIRGQEAIGSVSAASAELCLSRLWTRSVNLRSRGWEKWGKICSLLLKRGSAALRWKVSPHLLPLSKSSLTHLPLY